MPIEPSDVEMAYRADYHQDSQYIDRKRIACATCGISLTAKLKERGSVFVHPLLDTLQCKKCHLFYGDGDFSMDEDGSDKYCRMCGNGGELYICGKQSCPFGFCQKCIHRHLGENSNEVESDDWNCLHCNCKPLWEVRAVCAVIALERSRKPRKHRKETTRSERNDDSSRSEDSDSDLENTKPRSSRSRRKSENKCFQSNMRRTSRHSSKDSNDSISRIEKSNVSRKSGTSQKYVSRKAAGPSIRMGKVEKLSESNDDEPFLFEKERTCYRIRCSTKSIDAFAQVERQPVKQHNNRDSNNSIKRQQKIRPSLPKVYKAKTESLESLENLTNNSDSNSSDGSANEFVRNKKKRNLKSNKDRLGIKASNTQKMKGNHLGKSNFKANPSRSTGKIGSVVANRKTPESSLESKCTSRESSTHSFNDLETKTTKRNIQRNNRSSSSGSDRKTEIPKSCIRSNTADVLRGTGIIRHLTDLENENISVDKFLQTRTKVMSPNLNRESEKARTTKRLSTKPHHQTYLSTSSAEYDKQLLGARKASIKLCQTKFASTKDSVTKEQATAMRKHAENLMREMKMLRVGSSAGAEKIIQRHLPKNETSLAAISKMVQTCALLLVRCKEKWVRIEREFLDSYKDWCQRAEIESIFADMDNSDIIASSEVKKRSVDKSMENRVTENRDTKMALSSSTENSDASGDDNCKIVNQLACNSTSPISKTANFRSGTKKKLERIGLGNTKSLQKVNRSTLHSTKKVSDGDSISSKNDEMSECDSNEIFSEDENRGRTDTTTKPLNENIIGNSFDPNVVESDSNEGEKVDRDNLKTPGEESMHSGKVESHRSNLSNNSQEGNQASAELSKIQVCTDNNDQLQPSRDISHDDPYNVSKTAGKKDQCSLNAASSAEDILMSSELLAPPETDMPGQGTNEGLDDAQTADSLPLAELDGNVGHVSGCEAATVLDHSKSDNSTTHSETLHVIKSHESTASVDISKKTECLSVKDVDSIEIALQDDIRVKSDALNSSKDTSLPIVSSSNLQKGATNSDSDVSLGKESDASGVCNKPRKNEKVMPHSTAFSNRDKKTDSVGKNRKIGAERRETTEAHSDESSDSEAAIEKNKSESDSEEAIKKKILESDSELSNDSSEVPFPSDSFKLTVTSSSEEYPNKQVPAGPDAASDVSNIGKESEDLENSKKELETNLTSPASVSDANDNISIRNHLAKQRLLSDSDSSGSDEMMFNRSRNPDRRKSDSTSSLSNDKIFVESINNMESTSTPSSKSKSKKFNLARNDHYKTDKKLQVDCTVLVRRLEEKDLEPFSKLLTKSREHQELQNFKRYSHLREVFANYNFNSTLYGVKRLPTNRAMGLSGNNTITNVDLDNIKKRKKGLRASKQSGSGSESSLSESSSKGHAKKKKNKKVQEKEETLLDHFEKMKNGDNYCNLSGDEADQDKFALENALPGAVAEKEIIMQSNQVAKAKLMQSSDSENDMQTSIGNDDEPEPEEQSKVKGRTNKQKDNDITNEKEADAESSHENGSNTEKDNDETANIEEDADSEESDRTRKKKRLKQGLAARNWRLTDSDSSSQERKWTKSQESKGEEKSIEPKELGSRNKKKVKRRVLGSDSDSVKLTDLSDESAEEKAEKKNSSDSENSSEIFESLRKKKRKKRNTGQNSETTSESGQDAKSAKQKRKRIKKMESDSDSDSDNPNNSQDTPGKLQRKNIRKVLKDKQVADVTKIAGKEEEERLKRIAERQKLYNEMYEMKLATETKVDKLILDFDEETKKELISVHEGLVKRLKPHQAQGIKFMWDACFESLAQIKSTQGSGCIVAHCMGLGKTFQVVTLAHTLLTHAETGVKTIMVVCPLSTVLNWVNEFKKWLGDINNDEDVEVFEMTKMKKNIERKYQLERWQRAGGVMVLGYEMFRLLSNQKGKKMRKTLHEAILKCLVDPGPDLIVCDEGHLLKNEDTALSKAMRQVKTMRRIVLTGTPLQNNLVEYHCMVQFVKPNLLGTKKEFLNRFVNPITNGQFEDSTEYDVKLMKKRAHVLHKMLEGSVQRFDYSVLTPFLPPKQEYVITVRLADIQIKLYQYYLDNLAKKHTGAGTSLFADFQALQRIWTHPIVLRMNAEKVEKANEKKRMDMDTSDTEGSLKDFLDDGSSEKSSTSADSDIQSIDGSSDDKPSKPRRGTRANPVDEATFKLEDEEAPQAGEWWNQFIEPEHFEDLRISSKLVLLFAILKEAEQIGDKVLVFSQSLYALSLIEEFLNKIDDETQRGTCNELIDNHSGSWSLGLDYFRLDGQTAPEHRSQYCRIFNNPKNSRARLFLISTRAGGLGINLTAANRVIIFDASWNPSHDVQSIFRIYRFGQKKPCYVYRFLAQGTMEEKIYNRQVTKLSLSCRVVDEQQIDRHYSNHDLAELYQFDANTSADKPTLNLPKDRLLAEIFRKYEDRIETFHEHDSLLENKAEEELDEEERKEAWKEYEDERTGKRTYMHNFPNQNFAMQQYNDMLNMNQAEIVNRALLSGINIETLETLIRKDYPNSTPEQQKMMTQRAIIDMYSYMESESIRQQQMAAAAAAAAANNFTYPTVSNVGAGSFTDKNATSQGRQYALQQQQQQQQLHQIMAQRDAQANYAKRFGNVRGPALSAAPTRQQPQVVQIDDNDVMEVPVTSPATTMPVPASSVQTPAVPAPGGKSSKRQEE